MNELFSLWLYHKSKWFRACTASQQECLAARDRWQQRRRHLPFEILPADAEPDMYGQAVADQLGHSGMRMADPSLIRG
jgi:hypothetical protein